MHRKLYAVVRRGDVHELVRVELGGDTRVRPLPSGTRRVARANADRWLAAGENLAQLWGTTDGGTTWTPLSAEVDGDPSLFPVARPVCTERACSASPVWWAAPEVFIGYEPPHFIGPRVALDTWGTSFPPACE